MKTTLAACILAASIVQADAKIICALTDTKGAALSWVFEWTPNGDFIEIAARKDGRTLVHPPDEQPIWLVTPAPRTTRATYSPDTRFELVMSNRLEPLRDFISADAIMLRSGNLIAEGSCGIPTKDVPRPRRRL